MVQERTPMQITGSKRGSKARRLPGRRQYYQDLRRPERQVAPNAQATKERLDKFGLCPPVELPGYRQQGWITYLLRHADLAATELLASGAFTDSIHLRLPWLPDDRGPPRQRARWSGAPDGRDSGR